jgi:hypothetical protein
VYRRVARAIPMDAQFGGKAFACTGRYKLRNKDDPRFTDRRMQALLRAIL